MKSNAHIDPWLLAGSAATNLRTNGSAAILAVLVGCDQGWACIVKLRIEDVQVRADHWVMADLVGKGSEDRLLKTMLLPDSMGLTKISSEN